MLNGVYEIYNFTFRFLHNYVLVSTEHDYTRLRTLLNVKSYLRHEIFSYIAYLRQTYHFIYSY